MIKNKNQFKIALKNGNIKAIKRIYNFDSSNKINDSYNKGYNNWKCVYKYIAMINEIIEG